MIPNFSFASIPHIRFGAGSIQELRKLLPLFGKNILFITGKSSLEKSGKLEVIKSIFEDTSTKYSRIIIDHEPSPEDINIQVEKYRKNKLDLVVSVGGGAVLDAGKAISAMLMEKEPIEEFLEGVGTKTPSGKKIPFIAAPTTAGTGSEATKNAVISEIGKDGFKKSLRHDNYIPNYAIVDPELTLGCSSKLTAACGMDAFTQLVESFVSTQANPMTDVLALSGIKLMVENLVDVVKTKKNDINARSALSYATLISGITLANAGLGTIHGFASAIGSLVDIPHGIVCGTLMSEGNRITIKKLKEMPESIVKNTALKKYAQIGAIMNGQTLSNNSTEKDINDYSNLFVEELAEMTNQLNLEKFSVFGIKTDDIELIFSKGSNKNNPTPFNKEEIKEMIFNRM